MNERVHCPNNLPSHAWPRYPDFERYPEYRGKSPFWWNWYVLDEHWPVVWEVTGDLRTDATFRPGTRERAPSIVRRVVEAASREAAEAAFRLLTMDL